MLGEITHVRHNWSSVKVKCRPIHWILKNVQARRENCYRKSDKLLYDTE